VRRRGLLVALEGIDGAGISTQSRMLVKRLRREGYRAELTKEPTDGPVGRVIKSVLSGEVETHHRVLALLFAADRLMHLEEIYGLVRRGIVVVSDRYLLSSLAYQGLYLPDEWVRSINRYAPPADVTVIVDVPAEVALERISKRGKARELFEDREVLEAIRERFLMLGAEFGAVVVDGDRPPDEVHEDIWMALSEELGVEDREVQGG